MLRSRKHSEITTGLTALTIILLTALQPASSALAADTIKITGRVLSTSGVPIKDFHVYDDNETSATDMTDANGFYEITVRSPYRGRVEISKKNWKRITWYKIYPYSGFTTDQVENLEAAPLYCDAGITDPGGPFPRLCMNGIFEFKLKTFINSTSACDFYSEFLDSPVALVKGRDYPFEISTDGGNCAMWIDWDQDAVFTENERITVEAFSLSNAPYETGRTFTNDRIGVVSVPHDAATGLTRLRIRTAAYGEELNPCGDTEFGEVEDYEITIIEPAQDVEIFYGGGKGSEEEPFLIYTAEHLKSVSDNIFHWDNHFKLMADIDFNDPAADGFERIGNVKFAFTGIFDGSGHRISNFLYHQTGGHLSISAHRTGLFGILDAPGIVKNLHLTDPDVYSPNGNAVGAIAGLVKNGASILNCSTLAANVSGLYAVGAIAGASAGNIHGCYCDADVSGHGSIGALIGRVDGGLVNQCFAKGTVQAVELVEYPPGLISPIKDVTAAGFAASVYGGNIENCYSHANVFSQDYGAGFANYIKHTNSVNSSYSAGGVSAVHAGGFATSCPDYTSRCYWDIDKSGLTESAVGEGLENQQMHRQSSFIGWDFADQTPDGTQNIWRMPLGYYPVLAWQYAKARDGDITGDGYVDMADATILAAQWLGAPAIPSADIAPPGGDGKVNFLDFALLANNLFAN